MLIIFPFSWEKGLIVSFLLGDILSCAYKHLAMALIFKQVLRILGLCLWLLFENLKIKFRWSCIFFIFITYNSKKLPPYIDWYLYEVHPERTHW